MAKSVESYHGFAVGQEVKHAKTGERGVVRSPSSKESRPRVPILLDGNYKTAWAPNNILCVGENLMKKRESKTYHGFKVGERVRVTLTDGRIIEGKVTLPPIDEEHGPFVYVRNAKGESDGWYPHRITRISDDEPKTYHGFKVGERVRCGYDLKNIGVVCERPTNPNVHGYDKHFVPIKYEKSGSHDGFPPSNTFRLGDEPKTYHGFKIGDRIQTPVGTMRGTVCERPIDPKTLGYGAKWIPVIRDDGKHDGFPRDSIYIDDTTKFYHGYKVGELIVDKRNGAKYEVVDREGSGVEHLPKFIPTRLLGSERKGGMLPKHMTRKPKSYHGFKVGEKVRGKSTGTIYTVVERPTSTHELGYNERYVPLKTKDGQRKQTTPKNLERVEEEVKSYHGFKVGERVRKSKGDTKGRTYVVCERPGPDILGHHERWVPVINDDDGKHNGVHPDSLERVDDPDPSPNPCPPPDDDVWDMEPGQLRSDGATTYVLISRNMPSDTWNVVQIDDQGPSALDFAQLTFPANQLNGMKIIPC